MSSPISRSGASAIAAAFFLSSVLSFAQGAAISSASDTNSAAIHDLQTQVQEMRSLLEQMRSENAQSRAEMQELRQELRATRDALQHSNEPIPAQTSTVATQPTQESNPPATNSAAPSSAPLENRVDKLEESASLLGSKVDEQYQTKVETVSKYHARLSGIVLMNAFGNRGVFNNFDSPDYAQPVPPGTRQSSLGATLRQSEIGLEVFGPTVAGARTSANIQFDFAGGFPNTGNGVNFGIVRLQTSSLRLDWKNTSLVAGQDSLFVSPLSPTSFASLATPTFAFGGNLWGWIPQVRLEHRFSLSDEQSITIQGGIVDNVDWEFSADSFLRQPQAGEQSGQPAYAARTAWSRTIFGHPVTLGAAGYYGRQDWNWGRFVDAWAGMTDWQIPLSGRFILSGEFYRGRGIGGLGAAEGRSVLFNGDPTIPGSHPPLRGLNDIGGWSQLKFRLTPKIELNGTLAEDNAFAGDVRGFAIDANNFSTILGRNRGALGNVIYRPRSDLLFAAEFRHLRSFPVFSGSSGANQVNLSMGILF
ncbi:MAG TPA: hypothetical protein VFO39_19955 [Candidatus Sulfotelmatobacter sp.]|nr:hypothetical protein [Candidatus Sulfotelmatobacter sp.]